MSIILWYLYLAFFLLQGYFIFSIFLPLLKAERRPKRSPLPVSVIICAKNEVENLKENLSFILNQHYADFEVIVMDDHSDDGTQKFLKELEKEHRHLRYVKAKDEIKDKIGKKWALSEAIELSKNKHVLLTDADCRPSSLMWIGEMMSHFTGKTSIVLGIGQYNLTGKWFDGLIQYETLMTAITYLGFAALGKPYMGVGRNLAYQKRIFDKQVMTENELASGDDDLFIQKVANSHNTVICTDRKAQTFSDSPDSFLKWIDQKKRHYSTAISYSVRIKTQLVLLKSSFYLPNFLMIALIALKFHAGITLFIFIIRWLIWLIVLNRVKSRLGFSYPFYLLPLYEMYFSLFDLWTAKKNLRKSPVNWK